MRTLNALDLKLPPLALFVICGGLMWGIDRAVPGAAFPVTASRVVALAVASAGMAIGLAGILAFLRHGTTVNPVHPEEASAVVTTGVYRFTRNPMYLGLVVALLAWAIYLENPVALLVVPVFIAYMTQFQIKPEERAMLANFGADFAAYMTTVRRWI